MDYTKIGPFKKLMVEMGKKTHKFPEKRGISIIKGIAGGTPPFSYTGTVPMFFRTLTEGLGNKSWIAEWMYKNDGTGNNYYHGIGIDAMLMAINDLITIGAMPVIYTDEVACGDSEWFTDLKRAKDLASGFFETCEKIGIALVGGESPSLKYLIRSEFPVKSAPSLSGCIVGLVPKSRIVSGKYLQAGDVILGAKSSGVHANGISLVIQKAMALKDKFLTVLPDKKTLGEELLTPTMSYVALVEELLDADVKVHSFVPGTGGGVAKVAFDQRPFTYRIHSWPTNIPQIFSFMREECGVSIEGCLKTFNWGIGYYFFVPPAEVNKAMDAGKRVGYDICQLGRVEDGKRYVIFEPESIILPPPGE